MGNSNETQIERPETQIGEHKTKNIGTTHKSKDTKQESENMKQKL